MATSKKFLDENGLSTLWNQIENNFISSDNIKAIINTIDTLELRLTALEETTKKIQEKINNDMTDETTP